MSLTRRFFGIQHTSTAPVWLAGGATVTSPEATFNHSSLVIGSDWLVARPFNANYYYSSDDGASWTAAATLAANYTGKFASGTQAGRAVHYGNQLGTITLFYSDTPAAGTGWTAPTGTSAHSLKPTTIACAAIGAGKLVLMYTDGDVLYCDVTTMNGFTHLVGVVPTVTTSREVVFDGTRFVSIGASGETTTSTDGVTWSTGPTLGPTPLFGGREFTFGDDKIFIGESGASGSRKFHVSYDHGQTWTARDRPAFASGGNGVAYVYADGRLHAVQTGTGDAAYSDDDGVSWNMTTVPASTAFSEGYQWFDVLPSKVVAIEFGTTGATYLNR